MSTDSTKTSRQEKKIKIGNVDVILGLSVPFLWFLHKFPCVYKKCLDILMHTHINFLLMTHNTNAKLKDNLMCVHHTILLPSANSICSSEAHSHGMIKFHYSRSCHPIQHCRQESRLRHSFHNNNRYPIARLKNV